MLCILHLGSEKTGTSSIQKYFGVHRDALLNEGFWYPRAFANPAAHVHLNLSGAAVEGTLVDGAPGVAEFRKEYDQAKKAGAKTAVFSSEFFHSELRSSKSVSHLHAFLAQFFDSFRLVYYARRQDQMLASMHSTAVKGAWTADPDAMSVYESKGHYYFNHLSVCDLWAGQFGRDNLVCNIFEPARLVGGDIVEDFSAVIGLPQDKDRMRVSSNESLSLETMCALLLVNGSKHKDNKELRRKLVAMGKKRKGKRVPMLSRANAEAFCTRFRDSNREFFVKYVDRSVATDFSDDFSGFPASVPRLSPEEIQAFIFG